MAKGTAIRINTRAQNEAERLYSHTKGANHPAKDVPADWLAEVRRRRRAAT